LKAEHVFGAQLFADRYDMVRSLKRQLTGKTIAEIGVAHGNFSDFLLSELSPRIFDAYDLFTMHEWPSAWGEDTSKVLKGKRHIEFYRHRFHEPIARGTMRVFEGDGASNIRASNVSYDMIYIDAGHTREDVQRDVDASIGRLKKGGFLIFNDYIAFDHVAHETYGVVDVVNDLCVNHGWRLTHMGLHDRMFADVVLQKRDQRASLSPVSFLRGLFQPANLSGQLGFFRP
jgi:hypothetical protein